MIKCLFHLPGGRRWIAAHIAQTIFGFLRLSHDGIVDLSFSYDAEKDKALPPGSWLVEIDGRRVCCDIADANLNTPAEVDALLEKNFDFIFKRSLDPAIAREVKNKDRYLPLGLFFRFFPPRFNITVVERAQQSTFSRRFSRVLGILTNCNGIKSLIPYAADVDKYWTVGSMPNPDIDVLFTLRLWSNCASNPNGRQHENRLGHGACFTDAPDWKERTEERILFLREFREHFKEWKIVCGVSDSPLARELCPDLVLPHRVTDRANFRKMIGRAKVCVTTTGLWGSTGGKFTEFVSAGKAIVSNPLRHIVPGEFAEGKNYLAFTGKEELFDRCEYLLTRSEETRLMGLRNAWYYRHYVRPDMMVLNMIRTVLCEKIIM